MFKSLFTGSDNIDLMFGLKSKNRYVLIRVDLPKEKGMKITSIGNNII